MIARCCYLLVAISIIAIFLFTCFFQVVSESTCEGEWGVGNVGEDKTGLGKCVWRFGVTSALSNTSIFLRETVYEGGWLNGTKHGFGKYRSFSNIVYEGYWKGDKREGDGIMTINDRARYTGKWNNDTFTCDDASLTLICNNSCIQYPSQILTGLMTYKGKVVRGLPHGLGAISFSDSSRKIQITFFNGVIQDHSRGTLTLASDRAIQIDSFRESWDFLQHTAQAELSYTSPAGIITKYSWDGNKVIVDGDASSAFSAQNATQTQERSTSHARSSSQKDGAEVFELLNALKWFEYHFIKTQMMLESEVYSFESAEQHQKELERKMGAQAENNKDNKSQTPLNTEDTKEL